MAALRWAALNLWSSHDTARDDPPAATTDDESLRLAARRDHADALNDLAAALASGTGTNVDKAQAAKLFQRAAERGHSRAAANLENLNLSQ